MAPPNLLKKKDCRPKNKQKRQTSSTAPLPNDPRVDAALDGLLRAMQQRVWKKSESKALSHKAQSILKHMKHWLLALQNQLQVLQAGMQAWKDVLWHNLLTDCRHLQQSQSSTSSTAASANWISTLAPRLEQAFCAILRLHDGLILCTSGECRHEGDKRQRDAPHGQFPSHLTDAGPCRDGYTQLYQASLVYSGTGWDEWMDPANGLPVRLARELIGSSSTLMTPETLWNRIADHASYQPLETLLSNLESQLRCNQDDFLHIAQTAPLQLQKALLPTRVSVRMRLQDKMEFLSLTAGKARIVLERLAQDFQVNDPQGVLPAAWTSVEDWRPVMTARTASNAHPKQQQQQQQPNNKKRRRVIQESDSEEESGVVAPNKAKLPSSGASSTANNKQDASRSKQDVPTTTAPDPAPAPASGGGGLKKKVVMAPPPKAATKDGSVSTSPTNHSHSIRQIKQACGVNAAELEASLDQVQAEEGGQGGQDPLQHDNDDDDRAAVAEQVASSQATVQRLSRILKKAMQQTPVDYNEIWDARECLREALMEAGNQLLMLESSTAATNRETALTKALSYFRQAASLVQAQQGLHKVTLTQLPPHLRRIFGQNLILFRGQALVNTGMTRVERSQLLKRNDAKVELRRALEEFDQSLECGQTLLAQTTTTETHYTAAAEAEETVLMRLQAMHLQVLALRSKSKALWYQGRRTNAVTILERGVAALLPLLPNNNATVRDKEVVVQKELEFRTECYHGWTTLADLSYTALERASVSMLQEGDQLYDTTMQVLDKAALEAQAMERRLNAVGGDFQTFFQQEQISSLAELKAHRSELETWWRKRREAMTRPVVDSENHHPTTQRGDVQPDLLMNGSMPRRVYVVTEATQRKKRKRTMGAGYHHAARNPVTTTETSTACEDVPVQFRKWGDELLPQQIDPSSGRSVPVLSYPSIAPEMPPEIRAILARRGAPIPSN